MSYVKLSVLSDTLKTANSQGRTRFATIDDVLDLEEKYASMSVQEILEESKNQAIGKLSTERVTGMLGAPLASLMSASVLFEEYFTDEDLFGLHGIEQIGVQFKNIVKGGKWETDDSIKSAISVSSKYGMKDVILGAMDIVRGKADVSAVLEEPPVVISSDLVIKTDDNNNNNNNTPFDFSNL